MEVIECDRQRRLIVKEIKENVCARVAAVAHFVLAIFVDDYMAILHEKKQTLHRTMREMVVAIYTLLLYAAAVARSVCGNQAKRKRGRTSVRISIKRDSEIKSYD